MANFASVSGTAGFKIGNGTTYPYHIVTIGTIMPCKYAIREPIVALVSNFETNDVTS